MPETVPCSGGLATRESCAVGRARAGELLVVLGLTAALALSVSACGGGGAVTKLDQLRQVAKSCPQDSQVAGFVALDARGWLRGRQLSMARLAAVEVLATRVPVCGGGRVKVVAFGPSLFATATVFDDRLDPPGATENARLLRVPAIVAGCSQRCPGGLARGVWSADAGRGGSRRSARGGAGFR
jgi:hypothetical protein